MTRGPDKSGEYREAIRERYLKAGKKEKARILGEFTQVTGYHCSDTESARRTRRPSVCYAPAYGVYDEMVYSGKGSDGGDSGAMEVRW